MYDNDFNLDTESPHDKRMAGSLSGFASISREERVKPLMPLKAPPELSLPRQPDTYEIIHSLHIGDSEVVFGIDEQSENCYMCALCFTNELFSSYEKTMVGDDYVELMALYAERIQLQCEKLRQAQTQETSEKITPDMCLANDYKQSIEGKVVAVKLSELRHEYRSAAHQLIYVTGGNGAKANARGSACFHYNLYTGEHGRFERCDIQGEVKPEYLPDWAKARLEKLQREETKSVAHPPKKKDGQER